MKKHIGKLKVYSGPMFAAKTSMLLGDLVELEATYLIRPEFDKRYSEKDVITHDGFSATEAGLTVLLKETSWNVFHDEEFQKILAKEEVKTIGIDESQFFINIKDIINFFLLKNINVIVSCLNLASDGTLLQESGQVVAMADEHIILTSTCSGCSGKATRTFRKKQEIKKDKLLVGGSELYQPMCLSCWFLNQ